MELTIDPKRWEERSNWTGTSLFIRAKSPEGKWESVEITMLDKGKPSCVAEKQGRRQSMGRGCGGHTPRPWTSAPSEEGGIIKWTIKNQKN